MKNKIQKLFFILQFSVVLIPFTVLADIVYYTKKEGSLKDGIGNMSYDSMLNCSHDEWSHLLSIILICITIISCIITIIFKQKGKLNNGSNRESAGKDGTI